MNVVRIAVVEPNKPDARWLEFVLHDARLAAEVIHYPTGVSALEDWIANRQRAIDIVVVSDMLPMLALPEFLEAFRTLRPELPVVVTREPGTAAVANSAVRIVS